MNWKLMCRDMAPCVLVLVVEVLPWFAGKIVCVWMGKMGAWGDGKDGTHQRIAVDEAHPRQALEQGGVAAVLEEGQEVDQPASGRMGRGLAATQNQIQHSRH